MSGSVVVVSAHSADFVWRAAGAIALAAEAGADVHVISLYYGERGESGELWKEEGQTEERVKQIRHAEAQAAADALGASFRSLDLGDYPLEVDKDALSVLDSFDVPGNAEGLQFAADGNLLVALSAGVGIVRVVPSSPSSVLGTTSNPGLLWPVPLTVDQAGLMYTGDFEDGNGTAASDLFVFDANGTVVHSLEPSELHGPFGLVVAGTELPCGAYKQPR